VIVIAHLSDPHLDGTPDAHERLQRVTAYLRSLSRPVDVLVMTGDLADHGAAAEYAELAALLPAGALVCPGNHDQRAPLRAGLKDFVQASGAPGDPVNQVYDVAGARFVLLDSCVPGEDHGLLADETLGFLRDELAAVPAGMPVLVCFHHPPVEVGHPVIDGWRMFDEHRLAGVLAEFPGVVTALLAGHIHSAATATFAGTPLLVAPGIRSTVPLPWEPVGGDHTLLDRTAPPGVAFHLYDDTAGLRTHFRTLP
jgi:3',5'-cyclic-AMP phosphodiesterase